MAADQITTHVKTGEVVKLVRELHDAEGRCSTLTLTLVGAGRWHYMLDRYGASPLTGQQVAPSAEHAARGVLGLHWPEQIPVGVSAPPVAEVRTPEAQAPMLRRARKSVFSGEME